MPTEPLASDPLSKEEAWQVSTQTGSLSFLESYTSVLIAPFYAAGKHKLAARRHGRKAAAMISIALVCLLALSMTVCI